MIPILNFPQYRGADNTPDLMNWTVVVYWGSMLLVLIWYYVYAHKIYKGPKSNLDRDAVISGTDAKDVINAVISANRNVKFGPKGSDPEKSSGQIDDKDDEKKPEKVEIVG